MTIAIELSAPAFLLAVPQRGDHNFHRSVIFLIEHGDKGSMGLKLNHPADVDMPGFLRSVEVQVPPRTQGKVYRGGPVQTDRAFLLHVSDHEGPETEAILGPLKLSYSLESLKLLVNDPPEMMRVYLGYAGWGPGQLAQEMSAGAWLVAPATAEAVFSTADDALYDQTLRGLGIEPGQLVHSNAVN